MRRAPGSGPERAIVVECGDPVPHGYAGLGTGVGDAFANAMIAWVR
ncbi:hypothetical protein ACW9UR_05520 [Halovulum sp. GXIMD14794]